MKNRESELLAKTQKLLYRAHGNGGQRPEQKPREQGEHVGKIQFQKRSGGKDGELEKRNDVRQRGEYRAPRQNLGFGIGLHEKSASSKKIFRKPKIFGKQFFRGAPQSDHSFLIRTVTVGRGIPPRRRAENRAFIDFHYRKGLAPYPKES